MVCKLKELGKERSLRNKKIKICRKIRITVSVKSDSLAGIENKSLGQ